MILIASRDIVNHRYTSIKPYTEKLYIEDNTSVRFDGYYYIVHKGLLNTKQSYSNKKISNKMIDIEVSNYCICEKDGWKIEKNLQF